MKVYVLNYDLNKISNAVSELLKLTKTASEGIEIYSTEGIFYIDNNNTYKLLYTDKNITKLQNYYEQLELVIDKSVITREITSQLPPKHLANPIKTFVFKKDPQSKIKLVIIGNNSFNNINNINSNTMNNSNNMNTPFMEKKFNKDLQVIISDFYMDVPDDIDLNNIFIKEEISEFLSMLNKY
jgi:hypothetical protein